MLVSDFFEKTVATRERNVKHDLRPRKVLPLAAPAASAYIKPVEFARL